MGSSRIFSTPRERKKATALTCFPQDSAENFRKYFTINISEENKKEVAGVVFCGFFP